MVHCRRDVRASGSELPYIRDWIARAYQQKSISQWTNETVVREASLESDIVEKDEVEKVV